MRDGSLVMRGAQVRALPRPNRVWGVGRVCAERGCITRLSIYNRSTFCWAHEPAGVMSRGRRTGAEAA